MKYTEYITNMEPKLKEKEIVLLVNKKFTRVADKAKQFENFKTVKLSNLTIKHLLTKTLISQYQASQRTEGYSSCQDHHS